MVNNDDFDKFTSFSRLYMPISTSNFAWKSRHIFSFSLQWPGGSTVVGLIISVGIQRISGLWSYSDLSLEGRIYQADNSIIQINNNN